jgi:hypothetical protein
LAGGQENKVKRADAVEMDVDNENIIPYFNFDPNSRTDDVVKNKMPHIRGLGKDAVRPNISRKMVGEAMDRVQIPSRFEAD